MAKTAKLVSVMGVHVNWRARPAAWVAINIALLTAALTGLIRHTPWALLAVTVAGVCAVITAAVSTPRPVTGLRITWRSACLITATAWAAWLVLAGPSLIVWAAGVGATAVAVGGSLLVRHHHNAALEAAAARAAYFDELAENGSIAVRPAGSLFNGHNTNLTDYCANWVARIERVCKLDVSIRRAAVWDSGYGIDLYVELPVGGSSPAELRAQALALQADANLPRGCSVVVTDGEEGQRVAYIAVGHVNTLREDVPVARDYSPRSILDPITIGRYADGVETVVELQQQSMVVVGRKGSGKTNLLRVLIEQLMRCPDTLIWCIDIGGGGGLVRDLLRAYYDGKINRPPIDWPILDADTAEAALDALLAVIPARKGIYDTTNLHPTNQVPQIMVVTDELGNLPGYLKTKLTQVSDLGRASAVQEINCSLRGIESYIPRDLLVQSAEAVVLSVGNEGEAQYVFDWQSRIKISDVQGDPGRGLTRRTPFDGIGDGGVEQFKIPHLVRDGDRDDLADAAIALNRLRPTLDQPSADIVRDVSKGRYARRFEVAAALLWPGKYVKIPTADLIEPTGDTDVDAHRRNMANLEEELAGKSTEELLDMLGSPLPADNDTPDTPPAPPMEPPTLVSPEEAAELDALLDASSTTERIVAIILDAGHAGTSPAAVGDRLDEQGRAISDRHVRRVLKQLVKDGAVFTPSEGHYIHIRYRDRE